MTFPQSTSLLLRDGALQYFPQAFSTVDADALMRFCIEQLPWRQDHLRIAGRQIALPRLQCWIGDPGMTYSYSGIHLQPVPWPEPLLTVRDTAERLSGHRFNSALANFYRSGSDSVGWHSDDEPELGPEPVIASISFGETRIFHLRHKSPADDDVRLSLEHGSMLLMLGTTQRHWRHQLPKSRKVMGPRINLTLRRIVTPAQSRRGE